MIKHIVLWKLKEEFDRELVFRELYDEFEALTHKVTGLASWSMSLGFDGFDVALETVFEDRESFDRYVVQPEHQQYKKIPEKYRSERAACDYEFES